MSATIHDIRRGRTARLGPTRPVRLQIHVSAEERAQLDRAARAAGFESVAAYVRARTVGRPGPTAA